MAKEATKRYDGETRHMPADSAHEPGDCIDIGDGRVGVVLGEQSIAATDPYEVQVSGVYEFIANTGDTWSKGAHLFYDVSGNIVGQQQDFVMANDDLYVGRAATAKASGETVAQVELNREMDPNFEFPILMDCADGVDANTRTVIPQQLNVHGLLIKDLYASVEEQFAGTEDQGIILFEDEDGTDLASVTAADGGGDAVDDIVQGHRNGALSSGAAGLKVAAGKAVTVRVSQATTGSAAGQFLAFTKATPLA